MSDIQKVKESLDELDRLNGEIGRVKNILVSLKKEVEDAEVKKATAFLAIEQESGRKKSELQRLLNQIEAKTSELNSINTEIGKNKLILEDQNNERLIYVDRMERDEVARKAQDGALKERAKKLDDFEALLTKMDEEILEKNQHLNERGDIINSREKTADIQEARLENTRKDLEVLEKKVQDKKEKADEVIRTYAGRSAELDKRESDLNSKGVILLQDKALIEEREMSVSKKEADHKILENSFIERDKEISKKESSLVKRETDVILREAECRVREKALNIATREKQLDEQI